MTDETDMEPENPTGWSRMDPWEFYASGLLLYVNRQVLWPLGVALSVDVDREARKVRELFVQRVDPYDMIVYGEDPEGAEEAGIKKALGWMARRVAPAPQMLVDVQEATKVPSVEAEG